MIDVTYGNKYTYDLYLLYKHREDVKSSVLYELNPDARFKACDYVDFKTEMVEHNGVSHIDNAKISIKTYAFLNFANYDYVYDVKYHIMWKIENFSITDDVQMKEHSMRPRKITIINLIR